MGSRTPSPLWFVKQVERRVARHYRVHLLLIFLPPLLASLAAGFFAPSFLSIPSLPFSPFFLLTALFGLSLAFAFSFASRSVGGAELAARLIDEKIQGKERFLTLVTLPDSQTSGPLHPLLEQDAAQKADTFVPAHDVPFTFDRKKVIASLLGSALLLTLAFFTPAYLPSSSLLQEEGTETFAAMAEKFEQAASLLLQQPSPAAQEVGEKLLLLARDLRSPDLSPQEKRQRFAEARKQLQLDLPLPDLLPFDLHLFSKKQEEGAGQGEKPQDQPGSRGAQEQRSGGEIDSPLHPSTPAPPHNKEEQQKKPTPQQPGGGVQFDFPREKGDKEKPNRGPEKPGEGPTDAQAQAQSGRGPGQDPNQPGGGQTQEQLPGLQPGGVGKTGGIGTSPGERYYRPGEQPGGFLTKDARFVKVRVPRGVEPQEESGRRVPNVQRTAPLTPYSNAPLLPVGPPEQAQVKQPIPLEYRPILQNSKR